MYKNLSSLLREVLPSAFVLSTAIGVLLAIILGFPVLKPFTLGVALSFLNFILLSISTHLVMNFNSSKAKNLYMLFFIIRYMTIAVVVYMYASKNLFNIIYVILGITMVLLSIKINAFAKYYSDRKESKNGRNKGSI